MSERTVTDEPPFEDVRAVRPYLLAAAPLKTLVRRLLSIAMLVTIDISGLVLGLYVALALRSLIFDPRPVLWGLLWDHETTWLAFLILLLVLVFWRARALRAARAAGGRRPRRPEYVPRRCPGARLRRSAPASTSRHSASTSSARSSSPR